MQPPAELATALIHAHTGCFSALGVNSHPHLVSALTRNRFSPLTPSHSLLPALMQLAVDADVDVDIGANGLQGWEGPGASRI